MIILATAVVAAATWASANTVLSVFVALGTLLTMFGTAFLAIRRVLKRLEGTVNSELNHNGGSSLKDMARDARDGSRAALVSAERADHRSERVESLVKEFSKRLDEHTKSEAERIGGVTHDIREIRTSQAILSHFIQKGLGGPESSSA